MSDKKDKLPPTLSESAGAGDKETSNPDVRLSHRRRKLLKTLATGSGAVAGAGLLPDKWHKPVVNSVLLPAHAVGSPLGEIEPPPPPPPGDIGLWFAIDADSDFAPDYGTITSNTNIASMGDLDDDLSAHFAAYLSPPQAGVTVHLNATITGGGLDEDSLSIDRVTSDSGRAYLDDLPTDDIRGNDPTITFVLTAPGYNTRTVTINLSS